MINPLLFEIAGIFVGGLFATSMVLLGVAEHIGYRWMLSSPIIASGYTYMAEATLRQIAWLDANTFIAIGTLVLAGAAVAGFFYTARGYREIARQTSAAIEAAFPYFRLHGPPRRVTPELGGLPVLTWTGRIKHIAGSSPARDVRVWVRDCDHYYFAYMGVILPRGVGNFVACESDGMAEQCPWGVIRGETFADAFGVWLGIVWRCPDGTYRENLYQIQRNTQWEAQTLAADRLDASFRPTSPS